MESTTATTHNNYSFLSALKHHVSGSTILLLMAVLAIAWANSPWNDTYFAIWELPMSLQIGDFNLLNHGGHPLSVGGFINDALMAIFFFSVGLEIKREMLVGELSQLRQAMLPIVAACGGMLFPMLVYYAFTYGADEMTRGFAIPMATDIAFSLGVLNIFGKRVPLGIKVFLMAFAVVDDLGGILVIAIFYSSHISFGYLAASAVVVLLMCLGNRLGVRKKAFYFLGFLVLWYLFMQSGVHSTIAGVIAAFTVPASPQLNLGKYLQRIDNNLKLLPNLEDKNMHWTSNEIHLLKSIESASDKVISPLQSFEDKLHAPVNYFIMPLFALANAGVCVLVSDGESVFGVITLAVGLGLLVGKLVGLYAFTALPIHLGWLVRPKGLTDLRLVGVSLLGGIGFTVSLFIANLSFSSHPEMLAQAKLGVLLGTIVSGVLGYLFLARVLPADAEKEG